MRRCATITSMAFAIAAVIFSSSALQSFEGGPDIPSDFRGDGELTLYRPAKDELETFRYRDEDGSYNLEAFNRLSHFFRCRLTDEEHVMDPGLIEMLDAIEDRYGADEVMIVSAYRSPERNAMMRRSGRRVAKFSYHMEGMASDIEVEGVSPRELRLFAYSLGQGGVGSYRGRPFIHIDTGPIRTWGWYPPDSLVADVVKRTAHDGSSS